jgi:hypothetical protein
MITYKYIKKLIEKESGFTDIGIKSRKEEVRDLRYAYMKLCYMFVENFTTVKCGKLINRDHSTVIAGLKKFNLYYGTNSFLSNEIYDICFNKLKNNYLEFIGNDAKGKIKVLTEIISSYEKIKNNYINELNVNYEIIKQ